MYDDAWYNTFAPTPPSQGERAPASPKHRRRESLLKQPHESSQADPGQVEGIADIVEEPEQSSGPPEATVARRAKSYSDFYDAATAQLRRDARSGKEPRTAASSAKDVKTELDLRHWYKGIDRQLQDAGNEEYLLYRDSLHQSGAHLDLLLDSASSTLDLLSSLSESFKLVDAQTTAFRAQCHELLSEQRRFQTLADDIGKNLQFYNYLEPISRRLNAPGAGQFVRGKDFSEMLSNLDSCVEYMQAHPKHLESETYRSRYRLLLTRGLTLIRVHFVTSLREIAAEVTRRIADRQLNDTTMSALLYAKFRVGAGELKQVGREIQKRAVAPTDGESGGEAEYQSLMNELHQNYSATRGKLVIPLVRKKIGEIAMAPSTAKELVPFARTSLAHVRGVCSDEFELWSEWFDGEDGMYDFLDSVCEPLYDHLRPRIIHEISLPKLCELCTLIQTRYMRDQDEEAEVVETSQLDFSSLVQPALEDAQTRIVFRAQAILRDEIENFRPKADDLDYPACNRRIDLTNTKQSTAATSGRKGGGAAPATPLPKTPIVVDEDADTMDARDGRWDFDREATFEGWYPTLRKAIWLLSKIYRLVNSTVFDDLAHEIVHRTTISLQDASSQISSKASAVDGQLFLIKHLLILKTQIVAFDIEFVTPQIAFDFSSVTNTFWELRERGGLFNPSNLMRFMGGGLLPRVVENMLDAKAELDGRLRTVINEFTNTLAARTTTAISASSSSKRGFQGGAAVKAVREAAEKDVPLLRRKLDEYLDDARTKETLVGAVQDQVVQNYEHFYRKHAVYGKANGRASRPKGKGREDEVWDLDTFAEWTAGVYGVGREGMREGADESRSRSISLSRSGSA
ncbi:MAG: Golgi transport complex subunit 3 [Thelocarpon impressellum]|nr:MAG: Golgi transport complex subunit 3 [Thelocarpon impressellum]